MPTLSDPLIEHEHSCSRCSKRRRRSVGHSYTLERCFLATAAQCLDQVAPGKASRDIIVRFTCLNGAICLDSSGCIHERDLLAIVQELSTDTCDLGVVVLLHTLYVEVGS